MPQVLVITKSESAKDELERARLNGYVVIEENATRYKLSRPWSAAAEAECGIEQHPSPTSSTDTPEDDE